MPRQTHSHPRSPPCPAAPGGGGSLTSPGAPSRSSSRSLRSLPALPPAPPPRDVSAAACTAPLLAPRCPSQRLPQQQEGESHPLGPRHPGGVRSVPIPPAAAPPGRTGQEQEVQREKGSDARRSLRRDGHRQQAQGNRGSPSPQHSPFFSGPLLPGTYPCSPVPFSPAVTLFLHAELHSSIPSHPQTIPIPSHPILTFPIHILIPSPVLFL